MAKVRDKVLRGLSIPGQCFFITATLKLGGQGIVDVASVQKVWRQWLSNLKYQHPKYKATEWFKVVELTKKGQPHIHLLMRMPKGNFTGACTNRQCGDCVQCEMRVVWRKVTRRNTSTEESYILDVEDVRYIDRMATYITKYVTKTFFEVEGRRYATSRNWCESSELRLKGSESGWRSVKRIKRRRKNNDALDKRVVADRENDLMELVGDPVAITKMRASKRRAQIKEANKRANN